MKNRRLSILFVVILTTFVAGAIRPVYAQTQRDSLERETSFDTYRTIRNLTGVVPKTQWLTIETMVSYMGDEHNEYQYFGSLELCVTIGGRILLRGGERDYSGKARKSTPAFDLLVNIHNWKAASLGFGLFLSSPNQSASTGNAFALYIVGSFRPFSWMMLSVMGGPASGSEDSPGFNLGAGIMGSITEEIKLLAEFYGAGGGRNATGWLFTGVRYARLPYIIEIGYGGIADGLGYFLKASISL